jgi:hypothetical protein
MLGQYSHLNVPTWIIGEPLGTPGFDTKTRILKVRGVAIFAKAYLGASQPQ